MSRELYNPVMKAIAIRDISRSLASLALRNNLYDVSRLLDLSSYAANDSVMARANKCNGRMLTCLPELEMFHGKPINPWLQHTTSRSDTEGNFITVLQLDLAALSVAPDCLSALLATADNYNKRQNLQIQDIFAFAGTAEVDTFHIVNVSGCDPQNWFHLREDWTSQVVFARPRKSNDTFLSFILPIVRAQAIDAYLSVKLTKQPRLDKVARIISGELLEYSRLIYPFYLPKKQVILVVATQHERLGRSY